MKILHLVSSINVGGKERQISLLVHHNPVGFDTKLVYFNESNRTFIDKYELESHSVHLSAKGFWGKLIKLKKYINSEKPQVIYTWGNIESIMCLLLKPFFGFVFINGSIRHGIRSWKLSHFFRSVVLWISPNIVANSNAGLKANNLSRGEVLYNGIDSKFFEKVSLSERIRIKELILGESASKKVILSVANFRPYKDYPTVFSALAKIIELGYKDFVYLIIGEGSRRQEFEKMVVELDLSQHVKLLGRESQVELYLSIADLFIHSSKGEGLSNAILEAMAMGLPVIATRVGGTAEIVSNSTGRLFNYKCTEDLVSVLKEYFEFPIRFKSMGEEARNTARQNFSIESMIIRYTEIINKIYLNEIKKR